MGTLTIGATTYDVTEVPESEHKAYKLTGPREAVYFAYRNAHHPDMLFLVNGRPHRYNVPCEWLHELGPGELVVA